MDSSEIIVCSLCLAIVKHNNFENMTKVEENMLKLLIPEIHVKVIRGPKICRLCWESLHKCHKFKTNCIQNFIKVEVDCEQSIENKFCKPAVTPHLIKTEVSNKMCPLCFEDVAEESYVVYSSRKHNELLEKCLPELELADITVLCHNCLAALDDQFAFIDKCLITEKKIRDYCATYGTNANMLDLHQVRQSMFGQGAQNVEGRISYTENVTVLPKLEEGTNSTETYEAADHVTEEWENTQHEFKCVTPGNYTLRTVRSHLETKLYKCHSCQYESKYKSALNQHQLKHSDPLKLPAHKCSMCSYETKYKSALNSHLITHKAPSETPMYQCANCTFETKRKGALRKHMFTHRGPAAIKMYSCECCIYETNRKDSLNRHMLTHKNCSNKILLKCEKCMFYTKHKSNLNIHRLKHESVPNVTIYKCKVCLYQAKDKSTLKRHMLVHLGPSETPMFKCGLCDYESKRQDTVKHHMFMHKNSSGGAVYKCEQCTFQTNMKQSYRRHLVRHASLGVPTKVESSSGEGCHETCLSVG